MNRAPIASNAVLKGPERCVCGAVPKAEMRPHYVHGHMACGVCGRNIAECCAGETCETILPESVIIS
jgi:hypothetical protein